MLSTIIIAALVALAWIFILRITVIWGWALCFLAALLILLVMRYIRAKCPEPLVRWRTVNKPISVRDYAGFLLWFGVVMCLGTYQYSVTGVWRWVLAACFVLLTGFSFLYFHYLCPGQFEKAEIDGKPEKGSDSGSAQGSG